MSSSPPEAASCAVLTRAPTEPSVSLTSSQVSPPGSAHSSRTGSRSPSIPLRNGSGYAPTIAGMRCVALQSRLSHWITSPASTSQSAAPRSASTPFTK